MRLKQHIEEAVYGIELAELIKKHRDDGKYIVFTDENIPKQRPIRGMDGLSAVVGYPGKFIYNMSRRGQSFGVKGWVGARRLAVVQMLKGQMLDTKHYEAERYELDIEKLRKFYVKNGGTDEKWQAIRFECAKEAPKSLFRRLFRIMKKLTEETGYTYNTLFAHINFAAIYSHGMDSLESGNPEIYILNYRNLKKIENIEF